MPGHAALFDLSPAPLACGERPRTSRVWHFRLGVAALDTPASRVAHAIRETGQGQSRGAPDAILLSGGDAFHGLPADRFLACAASVAVALKATVPIEIEAPPTVTAELVTEFWTDDRWSTVGLVIPLDAPTSWVATHPTRWATLRDCLRVPRLTGHAQTSRRSMIARMYVGLVPDRAILAAVDELAREDGITTIAVCADLATRAGHVERVAHAIDALWAMGISVLEIPCDALGAVAAPQDVDRSVVDTLRKAFPLDVASADATMLARVPGIGRSAGRLVAARTAGELNHASDFTALGVDLSLARPFLRHHSL